MLAAAVTLLAAASVLPPASTWLMRMMLTQMLVQIPVLFSAAVLWATHVSWAPQARWLQWSAQGIPGLLLATFVLGFWMTPIALDHAVAAVLWDAAKIVSVLAAGFIGGISWRLASNVTRIFFVGNTVWMSISAGVLYQETSERLCNAYLWDDQSITGEALVGLSLISAGAWLLWLAARQLPQRPKTIHG